MDVRKQKNKNKKKETQSVEKKRVLITVNVVGSTGPIRFVVNEDDNVVRVIDTALKMYAREGRLPSLGSDANNFLLYLSNTEHEALSPCEAIGRLGGRSFVLCKKQSQADMVQRNRSETMANSNKGMTSWKAWLNKSFSFKISSH